MNYSISLNLLHLVQLNFLDITLSFEELYCSAVEAHEKAHLCPVIASLSIQLTHTGVAFSSSPSYILRLASITCYR